MIKHSIKAIVNQVKEAVKISEGNGRIHLNVMWEMGGTETILENVLVKSKVAFPRNFRGISPPDNFTNLLGL